MLNACQQFREKCIVHRKYVIYVLQVDSGRLDLLEHPLVGSLLHYKWKNFGMWVYFFNILTYLPFVLSLTTFALVVMSPEYKICK